MASDDQEDSLREGSEDILQGVTHLSKGVRQVSRSISGWFDRHPYLKYLLLTTVSIAITPLILQVGAFLEGLIFSRTLPISRDVSVEVFPIPIGFSLWLVSGAFVFLFLFTYFRLVGLQMRVEELESPDD